MMNHNVILRKLVRILPVAISILCFSLTALAASYEQTNLVSDIFGIAKVFDPNLKNSWGITFSGSSPIWIADNGSGVSTIYRGNGQPVQLGNPPQQFIVAIPSPGNAGCTTPPSSAPTGVIFNGSQAFVVSGPNASGPAIFIFATEDGTISGWNPSANFGCAVLKVDNSQGGAVY